MISRVVAVFLLSAAVLFAAEAITPQAAIGWKLFFDPILSGPKNTSCATCHIPEKGYESGVPLGKGAYGDLLPRQAPTVVNLGEAKYFFWDGRAASLEEQAKGPIQNSIEMDLSHDDAVKRLKADETYRQAFEQTGVTEIGIDAIANAIAAFERKLTTGRTLYDTWLSGQRAVFNASQERGRLIFFTRGQCATCHIGHNFTDGDFHNIGTGSAKDPGRSAISNDDYDLGSFKTPSLRNWKTREPFMHDGRFATLDQVLEFYNETKDGALGETEIDPLRLSPEELTDLKAFLETLNGDWPDLEPFEEAWQALLRR